MTPKLTNKKENNYQSKTKACKLNKQRKHEASNEMTVSIFFIHYV